MTKELEPILNKGAIQKISVKKRSLFEQPVFSRKKDGGAEL